MLIQRGYKIIDKEIVRNSEIKQEMKIELDIENLLQMQI